MKMLFAGVFVIGLLVGYAFGDIPVNCTYEDVKGDWIFLESEREFNSSIDCTNFTGRPVYELNFKLQFPDVAVDEFGNKGFWTIVYNQGFEVVINHRKYFAFFSYKQNPDGSVTSYCNQTLPSWSHDVLGHNWACYGGIKVQSAWKFDRGLSNRSPKTSMFHANEYVDWINKFQNDWRAAVYPELYEMSPDGLLRRAGGIRSLIHSPPPTSSIHLMLERTVSQLPSSFDWRNVNGINFVSPVRNQGQCGSCYAFSSLGMLEARLQIMTNNTLKVQFSPQDVVSCSPYAQGCEGGFPYVTAGKYAQDFGVLPESCYPYEGHDGNCSKTDCRRFYVADYKYVGGYFGGCNDELMRLDLVQNGPVTVAMEVYPDFMNYRSGIYHHTGIGAKFNPFHLVNHGVLITGYGIDNSSGEKFWIVKNSWGTTWGEDGYFRIRRGTNECSIESMAVSAIPIP